MTGFVGGAATLLNSSATATKGVSGRDKGEDGGAFDRAVGAFGDTSGGKSGNDQGGGLDGRNQAAGKVSAGDAASADRNALIRALRDAIASADGSAIEDALGRLAAADADVAQALAEVGSAGEGLAELLAEMGDILADDGDAKTNAGGDLLDILQQSVERLVDAGASGDVTNDAGADRPNGAANDSGQVPLARQVAELIAAGSMSAAADAMTAKADGAAGQNSREVLAALLRQAAGGGDKSGPDQNSDASLQQDGENDPLFRFARADGKMTNDIVARAEAAVRAGDAKPEAGLPKAGSIASDDSVVGKTTLADVNADRMIAPVEKPERTLTAADLSIVDSRKYLGVATSQTAVASVISAVTENAEWNSMLREASAISATTLNAAKNASNSLKIQLNPPELGSVMATFRLSGGHLSIELKVETMEAYRQLSDDQSGIMKALRGHGYDVDQVVIQQTGGERAQLVNGTSNLQNGGSATSGGLNEGGSTGDGRERGGEAGQRQNSRSENGNGEGGGQAGGRDPGGDIYL